MVELTNIRMDANPLDGVHAVLYLVTMKTESNLNYIHSVHNSLVQMRALGTSLHVL